MRKYIAITGASSGIGWAAAEKFAEQGKDLILIARREERLETLKRALLTKYPDMDIVIKITDLTDSTGIETLFRTLDNYFIEAWINNAGFGHYGSVSEQPLSKTRQLLALNVEAVTLFSLLYVRKYQSIKGTQLINVSSAGGYTMVPTAVTYCASKFYVSAFTEGLALELQTARLPLQAKVFAPAATQTEFGKRANDRKNYAYNQAFQKYHSSEEVADFLLELYRSERSVGLVDRNRFSFSLLNHQFTYAEDASANQNSE